MAVGETESTDSASVTANQQPIVHFADQLPLEDRDRVWPIHKADQAKRCVSHFRFGSLHANCGPHREKSRDAEPIGIGVGKATDAFKEGNALIFLSWSAESGTTIKREIRVQARRPGGLGETAGVSGNTSPASCRINRSANGTEGFPRTTEEIANAIACVRRCSTVSQGLLVTLRKGDRSGPASTMRRPATRMCRKNRSRRPTDR